MSLVKLNNNAVKNVTSFGSIGSGSLTFITKVTASSSSTVSLVNGSNSVVLDNTYKEYLFIFNNIHASNDDVHFLFNGSDDTSSHSYDVTKTTSAFMAYHNEGGSDANLAYSASGDVAQGTGFQNLTTGDTLADNNDRSLGGYLRLFDPSSTTFVKHFIAETTVSGASNYNSHAFFAGYFNTTSAITALQFKAASGNIDSGDIVLYGIN
tara:strand:+ start:1323 stop:1949 length:627 start_codon:yes stop_codon:yes gene_type:complete